MTKNDNLTGKQLKALDGLYTGLTIEAAAKQAGTTSRSLLRWLESDATFQAAAQQIQLTVMGSIIRRLLAMATKALDSLDDLMDNPQQRGAHVKRMAARDVLYLLAKYHEALDVEQRLTALERQVKNEQRPFEFDTFSKFRESSHEN